MNANNSTETTRPAPKWAISSLPDDPNDKTVIRYAGPELSTDDRMSLHIEKLESATDVSHTINLYVSGNESYPAAHFWIDIEEDSIGECSEFARRISAQLLIGANAMDAARREENTPS